MNAVARALKERLQSRSATVAVVGLGYVGLPLAVAFARAGFAVIGVDADPRRLQQLARGDSPVEDVSGRDIAECLAAGRFRVTESGAALGEADAVVICVPTPLSKSREPDISHIVAAADAVARVLREGQLVVLESTTYPGTTEEVLLPRFAGPGRTVGEHFFLAFSPERVDPGNATHRLGSIPKVVGGVTSSCLELAATLYAQVVERVVPVSTPQAAEMVKLFENVFRSVNIALVNELALMCRHLGLSVWEIVAAAATKPFGFMSFSPGPGIGGHCLPSDPHYLAWRARLAGYEARFIAFADEINGGMPRYVVELAAEALNARERSVRGSRILALGVAYKAGVGDVRDSPALDIIEALADKGARVEYVDPHVPEVAAGRWRLTGLPWKDAALGGYDLVLVLTAHPEFDARRIVTEARLVLDTRNLTGPLGPHAHVIRL
jgi:UDP-N-acetyl-D-glucosamine dehydrogenase